MPIATREQVDALKKNWKNDPCFDLWNVGEEFLPYMDELMEYHAQCEKGWHDAYFDKLTQMTFRLKCSIELSEYLLELETTIKKLKEMIG